MKAGMRSLVTTIPLTMPSSPPSTSATRMTGTAPSVGSRSASTTPQSASIVATDRSKAPLTMTTVMPAAPMPMNDDCSRTDCTLAIWREFSLVRAMTTTARSSRYWIVYRARLCPNQASRRRSGPSSTWATGDAVALTADPRRRLA